MIFMIAYIVENNKTIGFRLLDTNTRQVMNTTYDSVASALKSNKVEIENIKIQRDGSLYYNTRLMDYTSVNRQGVLLSEQSYVVLRSIGNGYVISDYLGNTQEILKYQALQLNIANRYSIERQETKRVLRGSAKDEELRHMASKIAHKIKSKEKIDQYTDMILLPCNYTIAYKIDGEQCILMLRDEERKPIDKRVFEIHSSKGWSIVDVYAANIISLLRIIP